jgi:hypothetical protein
MHRGLALYSYRLKESKLVRLAPKESPMIIGMFASTRGMKLAVLHLVRFLVAKKSLETIAVILAQIPLAKAIAGSWF